MCGLEITVEGAKITGIRGDEQDPFSRGHICPKAVALGDIHEDPDRLKRPMKRTASGWQEIGWEQAFDEVAQKLAEIREKHGRDATALYQGNPTVHNHGSMIHGQMFTKALGTRSRFSATSLDQLPQMLAGLEMFGHQLLVPIPDLDRTDYLLMLGANPVASNGSLMTAAGVARRLKDLQKRGGKLVVIDPRRTETAEIADRHEMIRPGTDALFLLALLHLLEPKPSHVTPFTDGLDTAKALARPFAPERVAEATGIAAENIRAIAAELQDAKSSAVYGRVGVCTQEFGGLASWLINVLNVVTGNLDRAGGVMFTKPAIDVVAITARLGQQGHFARRRTRVRGLPEFGGEYPAAAMAEEMDTPGPGQIKALVTSCGNPVLSSPNGPRLEKALPSLEFMISVDIYLNETTRHAHYILPPTFGVEHSHYDLAFHVFQVRNTAKYSEALFEREKGARHDWEIFMELASRLEAPTLSKIARPLLRKVGPDAALDIALRTGPHRLSLKQLKKNPHGIDLGALEPCLPERLYTANKRIALVPEIYVKDIERLEKRLATPAQPLTLIGRRELRSNNSWMHNSDRLVKGKDRCTLLMHPDDAKKRGLDQRAEVRIASRAGELTVKLEITADMMPGVVSLPHGWGHHRPGTRMRIAEAHAGASVNDLTDELVLDELTGTVNFSGVPVSVS